jgi:Bacterial extracellular solute-binding proteins, family 3
MKDGLGRAVPQAAAATTSSPNDPPMPRRGPARRRCAGGQKADSHHGVAVDITRELGVRLGVTVELACFAAARESLAAMARGDADICFLAIEPARAAEVAFTTPYVVIEGSSSSPGSPPSPRSPMLAVPACASA